MKDLYTVIEPNSCSEHDLLLRLRNR